LVALVDYGSGNLRSVQKACEYVGMQVVVTQNPGDIKKADKLILPGVGAFDDSMATLARLKLVSCIRDFINSGKPYLGICLGMQLLFSGSEEGREVKGLQIFKGTVKRFRLGEGFKIPHMGWNSVVSNPNIRGAERRILEGIDEGTFFYFCHSYYADPEDKSIIALSCNYGIDFAAMICAGNIYGTQFHPEKSQESGLRVLSNFAKL